MKKRICRVMDANFNRVREGLRVCEEFVRFFSNDASLTRDFKKTRNRIGRIYNIFFRNRKDLFLSRDVIKDVGKKGFPFEKRRAKAIDVFWANIQRSKEGLRVLEEFSKLIDKDFSDEFRKLRFKLYELEKSSFRKLQSLLGSKS